MLANYGHMNRSTALANGCRSKGPAEGPAGASRRMDWVFPCAATHFAQRKECMETSRGEKRSRSPQSHALKAAQSAVEMEVVDMGVVWFAQWSSGLVAQVLQAVRGSTWQLMWGLERLAGIMEGRTTMRLDKY
ncbi:hypothetical protein MHYP_G00040480 [Metynnis hypsauchen]